MIVGVFGLPGAGKSTFLTWLILRALKCKPLFIGHFSYKKQIGEFRTYKRVFSNIPIDGTYKLDFDALGKYDFNDSLIIIDEIGTLYIENHRSTITYFLVSVQRLTTIYNVRSMMSMKTQEIPQTIVKIFPFARIAERSYFVNNYQ